MDQRVGDAVMHREFVHNAVGALATGLAARYRPLSEWEWRVMTVLLRPDRSPSDWFYYTILALWLSMIPCILAEAALLATNRVKELPTRATVAVASAVVVVTVFVIAAVADVATRLRINEAPDTDFSWANLDHLHGMMANPAHRGGTFRIYVPDGITPPRAVDGNSRFAIAGDRDVIYRVTHRGPMTHGTDYIVKWEVCETFSSQRVTISTPVRNRRMPMGQKGPI